MADTLRHGVDTLGAAAEPLHAVGDTLLAVGGHGAGHGEGNLFAELLHHLYDAPKMETPFGHVSLPHFPPIDVGGITIDLSITKHVVFLWIAAAVLCVGTIAVARRQARREE